MSSRGRGGEEMEGLRGAEAQRGLARGGGLADCMEGDETSLGPDSRAVSTVVDGQR